MPHHNKNKARTAVTELDGLVDAGGGAGGHGGGELAVLGHHIHLHGGVPAGVDDLPALLEWEMKGGGGGKVRGGQLMGAKQVCRRSAIDTIVAFDRSWGPCMRRRTLIAVMVEAERAVAWVERRAAALAAEDPRVIMAPDGSEVDL
jgi:hypothetical protein